MRRLCWFIILVILAAGCSRGPAPSSLTKYTKSGEFFGGTVRVDVCYDARRRPLLDEAVGAIWARFADIHRRMSIYDPQSDISRINNAYPGAVTVGADTYGLIRDAVHYHRMSKGVFDITFSPLMTLWKTAEKRNALPTAEEIGRAKQSMDIGAVEFLPGSQIRMNKPGVTIDVDSIADAYAGDEAAKILHAHGFQNFLVDTTGDLYAAGTNCEGRPWRVGVQDPATPDRLLDVLELTGTAVSTSGNYGHFYTIRGQRWSHIFNPVTGYPPRDVVSATAIAPVLEFAGFWTKVLTILPPAQSLAMTDALGDGYAGMVVIDRGDGTYERKESRHYARYLSRDRSASRLHHMIWNGPPKER